MGKAEIDRDAARFFLWQPVGVDPGERFDQRGLAVIDMAGGRENEILCRHVAFVRSTQNRRLILSAAKNFARYPDDCL